MKKNKSVSIIRPDKGLPRDKARELLARKFLWELLAHAKTQIDVVTWIKEGGLDAEEFLECVDDGRWHPLLRRWKARKATVAANRQGPTAREALGRRLIVLAVIALERTHSFAKKDEAREEVAKVAARLFENPPSAETIHHWHRALEPLGPKDEIVLAEGIARAKDDREALIIHFVGLAHMVMTPAPFLDVQDPPPLTAREREASSRAEPPLVGSGRKEEKP